MVILTLFEILYKGFQNVQRAIREFENGNDFKK